MSDIDIFLSTKTEKYVLVHSSNLCVFKHSWFKHRIKLSVLKGTVIPLCF
jgi:hypothetical protein